MSSLVSDLILPADVRSLPVDRLDAYFGLWAIEPVRGMGMFDHAAKMDLRQHVQDSRRAMDDEDRDQEPKSYVSFLDANGKSFDSYSVKDAKGTLVAVFDIAGTMMKAETSFGSSTSTVRLRQEVRAARHNPQVGGAIARWDTPGGTVAGTADLANELAAFAAEKPLISFGEDCVASAGLWGASQARKFYANDPTAHIGSIGTFLGLYDLSGMAGQEGIKALVFSTGPLKGAGFPGAEITDEQKAYFQRIVDETQPNFTNAVAKGRKMPVERVKALATGEVFSAPVALAHGLIDGIQSFDATVAEVFQEIERANPASNNKRGSKMKTDADKTNADDATPEQVRASITADLNKFVARFGAENGAKWFTESKTYEAALDEHCKTLEAQLATAREDLTKAKAEGDAKVKDLEDRLAQAKLGEDKPASFRDGEKGSKKSEGKANNLGSNLGALASEIAGKLPGAKAAS